jgi:hypothetical protein
LLDAATGKESKLPKLPAGQIAALIFTRRRWSSGSTLPLTLRISDVYSLDLKTARFTHWAKAELNGFDTSDLREPELIKWKSLTEKMISGFVYQAANNL